VRHYVSPGDGDDYLVVYNRVYKVDNSISIFIGQGTAKYIKAVGCQDNTGTLYWLFVFIGQQYREIGSILRKSFIIIRRDVEGNFTPDIEGGIAENIIVVPVKPYTCL